MRAMPKMRKTVESDDEDDRLYEIYDQKVRAGMRFLTRWRDGMRVMTKT